MKSSRINYVAVGGFVILMIAALVVALGVLSGRTGATDAYTTVFPNVGGLKKGAQVLYEGYRIGRVTGIEPTRREGRTVFRVRLAVKQGWPIPEGSTARPAASGLLSAVAVQIQGSKKKALLEPGATIPGKPSGNIFAALNKAAGEVTSLSEERLRPLLATLNEHVDALGGMLRGTAPRILENVETLSGELRRRTPRLLDDAETVAGNLKAGSEELRRTLSADNRRKVESALSHLQKASKGAADLTRRLQATRKELDTLIKHVDSTVREADPAVKASLRHLRHTLETMARAIDTLTHNMEGTSRNMLEFSRRIRSNPGLLLRGSEVPAAPGEVDP